MTRKLFDSIQAILNLNEHKLTETFSRCYVETGFYVCILYCYINSLLKFFDKYNEN